MFHVVLGGSKHLSIFCLVIGDGVEVFYIISLRLIVAKLSMYIIKESEKHLIIII